MRHALQYRAKVITDAGAQWIGVCSCGEVLTKWRTLQGLRAGHKLHRNALRQSGH